MPTLGIALVVVTGTGGRAEGIADHGRINDVQHNEPFSWTGFYVGSHVGHAWANADWTFTEQVNFFADGGSKLSHDPHGWFSGGQVGLNRQVGPWVWGLEGTLSGGDVDKEARSPFAPDQDSFTTDIQTLWTVTGRLGYAWDRWLAYGKAGYAGGRIEVSAFDAANGTLANQTEVHHGWTVGGGIEYLLTRNLVLGVEYNYIDLGEAAYRTTIQNDTFHSPFRVDNDVTAHAVMGRLSYKFGR
jgi:outer membrane immunogenic protein